MPKIALIYPYFRTRSAAELLFPPLGLAGLAGHLDTLGLESRIFDCTFSTWDRLRQSLRSYAPDIAGIYSMVSMSKNAIRIAGMIEADLPRCLRVAGGPLPTLYPECYAGRFDAVFRGEADLAFPLFCKDVLGPGFDRERLKELPLGGYAGLFVRTGGLRADNPVVHYGEEEIRTFPLPDRSGFDHASYQDAWLRRDGTKTTSLITTLGCPFSCDFCSRPVFGDVFRRRDLDRVFEEIEMVRSLGYDNLWIADDNFTLDMSYLREFCSRIAGLDMSWSCLSRVTGIDKELAFLMRESGCGRVYLGLESGNEATLRLMNKKATIEQGEEAVRLFGAAGMEVAAFFIVGYPGETVSSIEDTFRLALDLPLDCISFNVPFPLPGSKLFDRIPFVDKHTDWDEENEVTFVYNSEFDPLWLQAGIRRTMELFAEKKRIYGCVSSCSK
jgi:anaerobic magnesium-protoporphyrin IX monomethyl ester cyclase